MKGNPITIVITLILGCLFLSACNDEPTDSPFVEPERDTTILVYAVATNSLRYNFVSDTTEMVKGASQINLDKVNVVIYATTYENNAQLLKLEKNKNGDCHFKVVKEFDSDLSSLDPSRINEVIDYVTDTYIASTYGLIFWSHSTASQPFLNGLNQISSQTMSYSFGQDKNQVLGQTFEINVNILAKSIPDDTFDFIWFDSCYMSNIETIFEFKNKCRYFVGYPTEVVDEGMPYHLTLPLLATKSPDIIGAAKRFYSYYTTEATYKIGTIAVIDMNEIEAWADFCGYFYKIDAMPSASSLFKYTRNSTGPFYDLGDYTKEMAKEAGLTLTDEEWNEHLDRLVVYKASTPRDFNGNLIPAERFSGISTHLYDFNSVSVTEEFYKSLSWFNNTFN